MEYPETLMSEEQVRREYAKLLDTNTDLVGMLQILLHCDAIDWDDGKDMVIKTLKEIGCTPATPPEDEVSDGPYC